MNSRQLALARAIADRDTVLREVGAAAPATVCLAEDRTHGRQAALEPLTPGRAAALEADRFPREIRTVAPVNHPRSLALSDSGEGQGGAVGCRTLRRG